MTLKLSLLHPNACEYVVTICLEQDPWVNAAVINVWTVSHIKVSSVTKASSSKDINNVLAFRLMNCRMPAPPLWFHLLGSNTRCHDAVAVTGGKSEEETRSRITETRRMDPCSCAGVTCPEATNCDKSLHDTVTEDRRKWCERAREKKGQEVRIQKDGKSVRLCFRLRSAWQPRVLSKGSLSVWQCDRVSAASVRVTYTSQWLLSVLLSVRAMSRTVEVTWHSISKVLVPISPPSHLKKWCSAKQRGRWGAESERRAGEAGPRREQIRHGDPSVGLRGRREGSEDRLLVTKEPFILPDRVLIHLNSLLLLICFSLHSKFANDSCNTHTHTLYCLYMYCK